MHNQLMIHLNTTIEKDGKFHHVCQRCGAEHATNRPNWVAPCNGPPCKYLGKETGELIACSSCSGKVSIKVTNCHLFTECTLSRVVARLGEKPLACCDLCDKYVASGTK